jgi:hypothetical protein
MQLNIFTKNSLTSEYLAKLFFILCQKYFYSAIKLLRVVLRFKQICL